MYRAFFPLVSAAVLLLASCESGGTADNGDHEQPVITISYPTQNANMAIGDTVHFSATVTDNDKLQGLYASLTGPASELYWDITPVVDGLSVYHLDTYWIVTGINNPPVHATFSVTATDQNQNGQVATKTVNITP